MNTSISISTPTTTVASTSANKDADNNAECFICCEKTNLIIPCINPVCTYAICNECYVKIDDKCPACRVSLLSYKETLANEHRIIVQTQAEQTQAEQTQAQAEQAQAQAEQAQAQPRQIINVTFFDMQDISCCTFFCITILLLVSPFLILVEYTCKILGKIYDYHIYLSENSETYIKLKMLGKIIFYLLGFRVIGWGVIKLLNTNDELIHEANTPDMYKFFNFYSFIYGIVIGIFTLFFITGAIIIYFRIILWLFLKLKYIYDYITTQAEQTQAEQTQAEQTQAETEIN